MAAILIIEDDSEIREILVTQLKDLGHMPMIADNLKDGLAMTLHGGFDLVLLDVNLPDGNGLDRLAELKSVTSEPEVIIITGEGTADGAKMAFEHGAWDYILKPFAAHDIKLSVERSLEYKMSKKALRASFNSIFDRSPIIGSSHRIMQSLNMAAQSAESDAAVLITGETGTGKELFAKTIHMNSRQKEDRYVVVDCAALPEQLVESVLFGNIKGAFTGADTSREGLVKKADGGTLFLDEVGELPLSIQAKFLRVLQEKKFKPVGGTEEIQSNFRLISATNRDLEDMTKSGQFRNDLLFRLKTIHIQLPALRDCKADIKDLTLHYIHLLCTRHGFETKGFVPDFLTALESYDWPGNARELISSIEKAVLANPESTMLYPNFLPNAIRLQNLRSSMTKQQSTESRSLAKAEGMRTIFLPDELFTPIKPLKELKNYITGEAEKLYFKELMEVTMGDIDRASTMAGISKSHFYSLLRKYLPATTPS